MFKLTRLLINNNSFSSTQKCCVSKLTTNLDAKDLVETKAIPKEVLEDTEADKKDLKWRSPWHQKEGDHYSMLRTFYSEHNHSNVMKFLQQPIDLSPTAIKRWWATRKEKESIALQQYIPERHQTLGNELATAHFVVYRGGAVKFYGDDFWVKMDQLGNYTLPKYYEKDKILQAIDCEDMDLYYEGLINMRDLRKVEWLSLNGCKKLDDWALDRISNTFSSSLLYLDLRNMPLITHRGIGALYKLEQLKILYVDQIFASEEFEMTYLMLQEIMPELDIRIE